MPRTHAQRADPDLTENDPSASIDPLDRRPIPMDRSTLKSTRVVWSVGWDNDWDDWEDLFNVDDVPRWPPETLSAPTGYHGTPDRWHNLLTPDVLANWTGTTTTPVSKEVVREAIGYFRDRRWYGDVTLRAILENQVRQHATDPFSLRFHVPTREHPDRVAALMLMVELITLFGRCRQRIDDRSKVAAEPTT